MRSGSRATCAIWRRNAPSLPVQSHHTRVISAQAHAWRSMKWVNLPYPTPIHHPSPTHPPHTHPPPPPPSPPAPAPHTLPPFSVGCRSGRLRVSDLRPLLALGERFVSPPPNPRAVHPHHLRHAAPPMPVILHTSTPPRDPEFVLCAILLQLCDDYPMISPACAPYSIANSKPSFRQTFRPFPESCSSLPLLLRVVGIS